MSATITNQSKLTLNLNDPLPPELPEGTYNVTCTAVSEEHDKNGRTYGRITWQVNSARDEANAYTEGKTISQSFFVANPTDKYDAYRKMVKHLKDMCNSLSVEPPTITPASDERFTYDDFAPFIESLVGRAGVARAWTSKKGFTQLSFDVSE